MKLKNLISIILLTIFLQSCGEKEKAFDPDSTKTIEIKIDLLKGDSPEFTTEILDTINLEIPGNPPLTSIQDIAFSEYFLLLLDRKQGLLKFDNNGSFLGKIGENGDGPDEYTLPYAIHLDEKENVVLVADWQKMTVISYDLEGNFKSSSQKLPGNPISFFKNNDTLLVVQETLNGTKEKPRQVLISSIEAKTLEVKNWERPLYGFHSDYTNSLRIPRILSRVNNAILFYMPIIRGDIRSHSNIDTIFRNEDGLLVPEYLLRFNGFDKTLQLGISEVVMSDKNAFLRFLYDNRPYFIVFGLENNRPLIHIRQLFDQEMTEEMIPKPLNGDVYYSILRGKENAIEKNPLIVSYRLTFGRN